MGEYWCKTSYNAILIIKTYDFTFIKDANVCLNFANNFLSWLRTVIVEDDPRVSYLIRFKEPFREIEVIFMGCNGTAAVNERFLGVL